MVEETCSLEPVAPARGDSRVRTHARPRLYPPPWSAPTLAAAPPAPRPAGARGADRPAGRRRRGLAQRPADGEPAAARRRAADRRALGAGRDRAGRSRGADDPGGEPAGHGAGARLPPCPGPLLPDGPAAAAGGGRAGGDHRPGGGEGGPPAPGPSLPRAGAADPRGVPVARAGPPRGVRRRGERRALLSRRGPVRVPRPARRSRAVAAGGLDPGALRDVFRAARHRGAGIRPGRAPRHAPGSDVRAPRLARHGVGRPAGGARLRDAADPRAGGLRPAQAPDRPAGAAEGGLPGFAGARRG